jgi:tRNA(Ile)-lysidine synthase
MSLILTNAILELHASHCIFIPDTRIVVAISGGQDSCALLHALHTLRRDLAIDLHAAHLNHGIRGAESDQDAENVREFCHNLAIALSVEKADVPARAKQRKVSLQVAAREVRHAFLERIASEVGASQIALGHTRDDHIETILLNILRGTGIEGLQGLPPVAGIKIRPLRNVSRQETGEYCHQNGIAFREDSSNRSLRYRRNRVRTELLPELETYYNPEVRAAILRLSEIAAQEGSYLQEQAQERFQRVCLAETHDRIALSVEKLCVEHLAIQRRLVRMAIQRLKGSLHEIEFSLIERCLNAMNIALESGISTGFTLPGQGIRVMIGRQEICLTRFVRLAPKPPVYRELSIPGETHIHEWGLTIRCLEMRAEPGMKLKAPEWTAYLDADALRFPLIVRSRLNGDVIAPLGMRGRHRKLQDIFTDRKVSLYERDRVPVIADSEGIVWVAGCVLSERVKIHAETERIIRIECRSFAHSL